MSELSGKRSEGWNSTEVWSLRSSFANKALRSRKLANV